MPHNTWKHICSKSDNKLIWLGVETCSSCGIKGEYDGLGLTGIEGMGNFGRLTGLPPIGPHMPKMPHYSEHCPACNGRSIVEIHQWNRWVSCRSCNGTGSIITVTETRFIEIQKAAWKLFDEWRLGNANESKRKEIVETQRTRVYKKIFKRDHYAPKRSKRTLRYFAKMNRLMYESIDPGPPDESILPQETDVIHEVYKEETLGDLLKYLIAYILIAKAIYFLLTFWN